MPVRHARLPRHSTPRRSSSRSPPRAIRRRSSSRPDGTTRYLEGEGGPPARRRHGRRVHGAHGSARAGLDRRPLHRRARRAPRPARSTTGSPLSRARRRARRASRMRSSTRSSASCSAPRRDRTTSRCSPSLLDPALAGAARADDPRRPRVAPRPPPGARASGCARPPCPDVDARDILLATWEAGANAIEHAGAGRRRVRQGRARRSPATASASASPTVAAGRSREMRHDRGLGLRLIEALMTTVDVERGPDGTRVVMERPLTREPARTRGRIQLTTDEMGGVTVVRVVGELDKLAIDQARSRLDPLVSRRQARGRSRRRDIHRQRRTPRALRACTRRRTSGDRHRARRRRLEPDRARDRRSSTSATSLPVLPTVEEAVAALLEVSGDDAPGSRRSDNDERSAPCHRVA